jgi:hypothetical protein
MEYLFIPNTEAKGYTYKSFLMKKNRTVCGLCKICQDHFGIGLRGLRAIYTYT